MPAHGRSAHSEPSWAGGCPRSSRIRASDLAGKAKVPDPAPESREGCYCGAPAGWSEAAPPAQAQRCFRSIRVLMSPLDGLEATEGSWVMMRTPACSQSLVTELPALPVSRAPGLSPSRPHPRAGERERQEQHPNHHGPGEGRLPLSRPESVHSEPVALQIPARGNVLEHKSDHGMVKKPPVTSPSLRIRSGLLPSPWTARPSRMGPPPSPALMRGPVSRP